MKLHIPAMAIVLATANLTSPPPAQLPLRAPAGQHGPMVREAFASAHAQPLIAELGKVLSAGADPACLASKAIEASQFEAHGSELMIKWGTRMIEGVESLVDQKVYAEKFAAGAELARLQEDTSVKRYLALEQPIRLAKVVDTVFEQFDRYVLIARIKLRAVSPLATGNEELLRQISTEDAEAKLGKFTAATKSAALKRFLALSAQSAAASTAAIKPAEAVQSAPHTFYRGVETDLAELCIGSGR